MACVVGDETGLVKVVGLSSTTPQILLQSGLQDRNKGVCALAVGQYDSEVISVHLDGTAMLLAGREDGNVPLRAIEIEGEIEALPISCTALSYDRETGTLASCAMDGLVNIMKIERADGGRLEMKEVFRFNARGPVEAAFFFTRPNPTNPSESHRCLAVGGMKNDVIVYRLDGRVVWSAKGLPHDSLGLQIPVFVTAICLLGNGELFAATGYRELRTYRMEKKSRAPITEICKPSWLVEAKIGCAVALGETQVLLSDSTGSILRVDMALKQVVGKYKGGAGTVRSLVLHPDGFIASVGLARHLYIHDCERGKLVLSHYLKQRLTACICLPGAMFEDKYVRKKDGELAVDEDLEMWKELKLAKGKKRTAEEEGAEKTAKKKAE